MKTLLLVSALVELGAGLVLTLAPSKAATLILGAPLEASAAVTIGRLAGGALLALGVACWLVRQDAQSRAATGLVTGMLVYNVAAVAVLAAAGMSPSVGVALWPAVVLHTGLGAWCVASIASAR